MPKLRDRYGSEVEPGDHVILNIQELDLPCWTVKDVSPDFTPGAPKGAIVVILSAANRMQILGDVPQQGIVRVRTKAEIDALASHQGRE